MGLGEPRKPVRQMVRECDTDSQGLLKSCIMCCATQRNPCKCHPNSMRRMRRDGGKGWAEQPLVELLGSVHPKREHVGTWGPQEPDSKQVPCSVMSETVATLSVVSPSFNAVS